MVIIAAVDKNWAIGNKNKLLVSIPNDMKHFRETTTGHIVVMGRKTLESFPQQKPLPNRINIVMTANKDYKPKDVTVVNSLEELKEKLAALNEEFPEKEVFVIGGESIYRQLIEDCDKAILTKIEAGYEADTYFPDLDEDPSWEITDCSDELTCFDICYSFVTYERKR